MIRATLADVRMSDLPRRIGKSAANTPEIAAAVNHATQRLINAAGEEGWVGGWAPVAFDVDPADPYITLPKQFSRIVNLDVCRRPITVHNDWYEYLPGGPGIAPDNTWPDWYSRTMEGYERGWVCTQTALPAASILRAYYTNVADVGKKLMATGLDSSGNEIWTDEGSDRINGEMLTLVNPWADTAATFGTITGIQKDVTKGDVLLKAVDPGTGAETLLSRYSPQETNPSYRRYYISRLPTGCCALAQTGTLQIQALAKLQYAPVYQDTDFLIIGNIPALILECEAIRYESMDTPTGAQLAVKKHRDAIKQLQNEQRSELGEQQIAVSVQRFPPGSLRRKAIGTLI